jgi:hypothetical protein
MIRLSQRSHKAVTKVKAVQIKTILSEPQLKTTTTTERKLRPKTHLGCLMYAYNKNWDKFTTLKDNYPEDS